MKQVKRVLALLLAMSMLLTMAVFAEEAADAQPTAGAELISEQPTKAPGAESTKAPEGESTEAPEAEANEAPEEESTEEPEAETTEAPEGESTEAPEADATEAPEGESTEAPEGESTEAPEGESTEAPEADATEAPEADATEAPEADATEAPEAESTDAPETEAEDTPAEGDAPAEDEADAEAEASFGYTVSFENGELVLNRIRTDCKHDGERKKGTDRHIAGVAPLDDKQHKVTYQNYDYEQCTLCELYISYVVGAVEEVKEDHAWNNGYCSACRYDCEHTTMNWVPDGNARDTYRTLNSKQCQPFTAQSYSGTCDICGDEVSETRYTPNGEPADHVFDADGRCTNCYYDPANDYYNGGAECPDHPEGHDFEVDSRYINDGTYTPKDDKLHIVKDYSLTITYRCKNCDTTKYEEELHFGEELEEKHDIYNGRCYDCGYIVPECTHPNAHFNGSSFEADLGIEAVQSNGDGTHTGKWIQTDTYYCPDCKQNFGVESIREGIYPCNFNYSDHKCVVCGYECSHPNLETSIYERAPYSSDETAVVVDDGNGRTHTWNCTYRETSYYCPICGYSETGTAEKLDTPYTEFHDVYVADYPDVKCHVCGGTPSGFLCKHEYTTTIEEGESGQSLPKDADSHYSVFRTSVECDICGVEVSSTETRKEAPHDWNKYGICRNCGYVCKHEGYDTTTVNDVFVETGKCTSVDKDTHTLNGRYETQVQCTHCGAAVSRTVTQADASETAEHDFDEGVCRDCGFTCDHEGYEHVESYSRYGYGNMIETDENGYSYTLIDYKSEGPTGHYTTYIRRTDTECSHCGAIFSITFDPNFKGETRPHTMKDGACTLCGYEYNAEDGPIVVEGLIQDAAPEDNVHTSDDAHWDANPQGFYEHSTQQTIVTIVLEEDGWVEWNISLIGGGSYGSGRRFLKAGEPFNITWDGTNGQHYHPEGLATFQVDVTVTSADGTRTQSWSTNYEIEYTHSSSMDVANQSSSGNPGTSTGTNSGSTNSNMPKTGDREVSAATWLLLAACAFAGWLLVRKLRRD